MKHVKSTNFFVFFILAFLMAGIALAATGDDGVYSPLL